MKKNNAKSGLCPNFAQISLKMKLTAILLIVSFFSIQASTYSQNTKISLDLQETTIEGVFNKIESLTEFRFLYKNKELDLNRKVSIKVNKKKITTILETLFRGTNVSYQVFDERQIVLSIKQEKAGLQKESSASMQESVSGIIVDKDNMPLAGVTVIVEGTTTGTQSDFDGNYAIKATAGQVLVFSYVGMKTEKIAVADQKTINVTMEEDVSDLEEIVVVAYGRQKKSHLTAAVAQVKGVALQNRPLRTVADGLAGLVAGLNVRIPSGAPESTPNLNIRGFTGLGLDSQGNLVPQTAQPLILIDGIERSIGDVNPNDVESISVLKDGAASAIYGSRAPYGAVIITTKKGTKGDKVSIRYSVNTSFDTPTNVPEFQESYDWAELINVAERNRGGGGRNGYFSELVIDRMRAFAIGDFTNSVFDGLDPAHVPFGVYPENARNWAGNNRAFGNTKWLEEAIKSFVPSQQHNLSISGGNQNTTYYTSFGYNQSNGIFKGINDHRDRFNALLSLDTQVNNWLKFNASVNYVRTDDIGPTVYGNGRNYGQAWQTLARAFPNHVRTTPLGGNYRFNTLPNFNGESGNEEVSRNDLTLTGGFKIQPLKGWDINGRYSYRNNSRHFKRTNFVVKQVLVTGEIVNSQRTGRTASTDRRMDLTDYQTFDINTSYTKTFGDKHNVYALVGVQQEDYNYTRLQGTGIDFFSTSIPTLSGVSGERSSNDNLEDWGTRGFYGRLSYNFDEKYFVEFNIRRDATSRFRSEDRWATFPSVSGSWNIAKENFWPLKNHISLFKLRGSWATSGDSNPNRLGNYPFYPSIQTGQYTAGNGNAVILDGQLVSYVSQPQLVANTLTWAKPTSLDFAIDINAFDNRLDLTYDWFQRTINDQFGPPAVLPEALGTAVPLSNNSTTETRGWEFSMNWRDKAFNLANKDFNYSVGFRISDYVGYVVDFEENGTGVRGGQWIRGEVFGRNFTYLSNGIMQNTADLYANVPISGSWYYPGDLALRDLNGDGQINTGEGGTWYAQGDRVENGFTYPRKTYGISLGADWNGFDFAINLDGVGEWKKYSNNHYVFGHGNDRWWSPLYKENVDLGYWAPDNTSAFYPRLQFPRKNTDRANDQYTLDLAHLRIRNIRLGYRFPKIKGLGSLYTYVNVENLGFIYQNSFVKYDPELLSSSNGEGYPPQRRFSFGLNVEF